MAQYEMGLRDYWRIFRKRKVAVIVTCLVTAGLTFLLTQHVFREPPRFSATCELDIRPAEVAGYRSPVSPPNVAQQAKIAKSERLLKRVLAAIETHPFYAGGRRAEPGETRGRRGEAELEERLHRALARERAGTRDLACLFGDQKRNASVARIIDAAKKQEEAAKELRTKSPKARAAALRTFEHFLHRDAEMRETLVARMQGNTEVEWDTVTNTFKLTVQAKAPGFSAGEKQRGADAAVRISETIATVYATHAEWESRLSIANEIRRIEGEIEELQRERTKLEDDRRKKQEQIEAATATEEYEEARRGMVSAVDQLNLLQRYQEQVATYLESRAQIDDATEGGYPPIPTPIGIQDANILELYRTSTLLEKDKNDKLEFHRADSHVIRALDNKIGRTATQLQQVLVGALENEKHRVEAARRRFDDAKARLPLELRAEVADLTQKIHYITGNITAQTKRANELALFEAQGMRVRINERPGSAEELGRAGAVAKTLVGALVGLVLGMVIAVMLETFDLTIGTIEEVETFLQTRVLGVVPHIEAERVAVDLRERDPEAAAESDEAELLRRAMLVVLYDPKSVPAESFRHIRTSLDFARQQMQPEAKVFLITSATLYEGKTMVAANLAVALAQSGKRTCLVECDLRRPQLHHIFGIDRRPGLYDVFVGKTTWQEARRTLSDFLLGRIGMEAAVGAPGMENLSVLPCGTVPPNPVELLGSDETRRLFRELREAYDAVVVDSPPILPVADAAVLSPLVDGVVLVYRAGAAPRTVLSRAKTELESVGAPLFGVVLNDLRPAGGDVTTTYPYKGYARKPYALAEEQPAPRVAVDLAEETAIDRAGEKTEDHVLRRIDLCLLQGKVEEAVRAGHEAVRTLPESISVRLELARAYAAAGRVGEAQAELIHVLDFDQRNLQALERLGQMALDGGLEREALRWYEDLLDFDPENATAKERLTDLRARLGEAGSEGV